MSFINKTIHLMLFLLLTVYFTYSAKAQKTEPNPNKNPVKAMFFQRYMNLISLFPTLNYHLKNKILLRYKKYESPLIKKGWQLTFEDNFDSINKQKWRLGQPWGDYHLGTLHQYFEAKNVIVRNGFLYLQGKRQPRKFSYNDTTIIIPYGIGLINSDISFKQKFGYFEIRSKNPAGPATWPAFWLTSADRWPPEIDIFEMYGKRDGRHVHKQISSVHFGIDGHRSRGTLVRKISLRGDTDTAFHVYGCSWSAKKIKFYTDGVLVKKQRINKRLRAWMDDEMVVIINNGFEPKYLKYLPHDFKGNALVVDWVRVYKKL